MEDINTYELLKDPEMKEILDSFLIETKEILDKLDLDLVMMESKPDDAELLNEVFRYFHTIKGTSGFLGLDKLTTVTHRCEDILNKLRKGEAKINQMIMDSVLMAYDKIKELLATIETNLNEDVETESVIISLNNTIDIMQNGTPNISEEPAQQTKKSKRTTAKKSAGKSKKIVKEKEPAKVNPDSVEAKHPESPADEKEEAEEDTITPGKTENARTLIEPEVNVKTESTRESVDKNPKQVDNTIRVDIQRLDELLNIASELVLGRNRLSQVSSEFAFENEGTKLSRDLAEAARQIDLMTNELQLIVMKTRMIKIGKVFNRFPRVVRDLCKGNRKKSKA